MTKIKLLHTNEIFTRCCQIVKVQYEIKFGLWALCFVLYFHSFGGLRLPILMLFLIPEINFVKESRKVQ